MCRVLARDGGRNNRHTATPPWDRKYKKMDLREEAGTAGGLGSHVNVRFWLRSQLISSRVPKALQGRDESAHFSLLRESAASVFSVYQFHDPLGSQRLGNGFNNPIFSRTRPPTLLSSCSKTLCALHAVLGLRSSFSAWSSVMRE